jgi:HEXXH motif-containing protein
LSLEAFDGISSGQQLGSAVPALMNGEYSRRVLLMRHIVTATRNHPELFEPGSSPELGWRVLSAAQARSATTIHHLITHPTSGLWAAHTTRRLAGVATDEAPLWIHLAHLSAIAASAAVLTGTEATLWIPVRHGVALLPLLGHARFAEQPAWALAELRTGDGETRLSLHGDPGRAMRIGSETAAGWFPARPIHASVDGLTVTAGLEVIDPYPGLFGLTPSPQTFDRDETVWTEALTAAWTLLVREHPEQADGLAAGLRSIIPLAADDPTSPASGSAADAFGAAALRRPNDPVDLAVALVHEFQHSVLNGLLHLVPLVEDDDRLYYAPWRDDPRTLTSLLHGAYAFSAVTRFWRTRQRLAIGRAAGSTVGSATGSMAGAEPGPAAEAAGFEFALWRSRTDRVLTTLVDAGSLTLLGQRLVHRLHDEIQEWNGEFVPERAVEAAGLAVRAHYAGWRAHHLHPDPDWVSRAADSWRRPSAEPAPVPLVGPNLSVDQSVPYLDDVARRFRAAFAAALHPEPGVEGGPVEARADPTESETGEAALVAGASERARQLFQDEITRAERPAAWGGLGLALAAAPGPGTHRSLDPGAETLMSQPESVRALYLTLRTDPEPPSVPALARWLAGGPPR